MQNSEVNLRVNGRNLVGNFYASDPDKSAVLFVHGFESSKSGYEEYAVEVAGEVGAACLTLDLGGHGKSEGDLTKLTINDHLAELRRAYDFLASRCGINPNWKINPQRIGIVGASYGAYLAALLSEERTLKSLLLRAPAIYPDKIEHLPRGAYDTPYIDEFRETLEPDTPNRALSAVASFAGTVAVVASECDESIPRAVPDAYAAVAQRPTIVEIPGAKHSLQDQEREMFKNLVVSFARAL
jgi:pimeloyl-ACP methyl ester carboxylesterase